ncbi:MAG TPA: hypothetical protein VMB52_01410 [Verrucomicrobiae bacterium]|nr:hypothetical protein [Verrucomicrobiae bacterium]
MSELTPVTFKLTDPWRHNSLFRQLMAMTISGVDVFRHGDVTTGTPFVLNANLETVVANGLASYMNDRFGHGASQIKTAAKVPNCHTSVAAAKSWIKPTGSDPNIDGTNTKGLRLYADEVYEVGLEVVDKMPAGEVLGVAYPDMDSDGTTLVAHSMLTLGVPDKHVSVNGKGGMPYVGSIAAVLSANEAIRPGSRLVHMADMPRQIGTDSWEAYAQTEYSLNSDDIEIMKQSYVGL